MRTPTGAAFSLLMAACLAACAVGPGMYGTLPPAQLAPFFDPPQPPEQSPPSGPYLNLHPPGVLGKRLVGFGTGFFIAPNKVLTNFHVVRPCMALTVGNNREGREIDARYDYGDPQADLAVLTTEPADVTPARFETEIGPETTQGLAVVGYPALGLPVLFAQLDRVIADAADVANERDLYPFSGTVHAGNSGSPVLNDRGAVVGVVTARLNTVRIFQDTGMLVADAGLAVPNRAVFGFLDRSGVEYLRAGAADTLPTGQVLAQAHGFVRQVGCWR